MVPLHPRDILWGLSYKERNDMTNDRDMVRTWLTQGWDGYGTSWWDSLWSSPLKFTLLHHHRYLCLGGEWSSGKLYKLVWNRAIRRKIWQPRLCLENISQDNSWMAWCSLWVVQSCKWLRRTACSVSIIILKESLSISLSISCYPNT